MPVRVLVTTGHVVDCSQAGALIKDFSNECLPAECPIADKGHDTNAVVAEAQILDMGRLGMEVVIPAQNEPRPPAPA
ncbi:MAG: hypothetical protein LBG65_02075 [Puniceicoccales bacterium]|nr:hypothetical protein [Puniceicoccales bacterium]